MPQATTIETITITRPFKVSFKCFNLFLTSICCMNLILYSENIYNYSYIIIKQ